MYIADIHFGNFVVYSTQLMLKFITHPKTVVLSVIFTPVSSISFETSGYALIICSRLNIYNSVGSSQCLPSTFPASTCVKTASEVAFGRF